MNEEDIKKIVNIAYEAVKDLDNPLKIEGFKLILNKLLEAGLDDMKPKHQKEKISHAESDLTENDPLSELAKVCECSESDLMNVIDFDKKNFVLLKKVEGKNLTEKVQNTSLCILTAWMKGKDIDWVDSITLGSAIYNSGVSNDDVGKKLRMKSDLFTIKGKKKGAKYRLTAPGWQKGVEILKSLV